MSHLATSASTPTDRFDTFISGPNFDQTSVEGLTDPYTAVPWDEHRRCAFLKRIQGICDEIKQYVAASQKAESHTLKTHFTDSIRGYEHARALEACILGPKNVMETYWRIEESLMLLRTHLKAKGIPEKCEREMKACMGEIFALPRPIVIEGVDYHISRDRIAVVVRRKVIRGMVKRDGPYISIRRLEPTVRFLNSDTDLSAKLERTVSDAGVGDEAATVYYKMAADLLHESLSEYSRKIVGRMFNPWVTVF
jgi:hypothetical protein